jgi:hypothetical protein
MNRALHELASPEPLHSEKQEREACSLTFPLFLQSFRLLNNSTTKSPAKRDGVRLPVTLLGSLQFGTGHYQVFAEKESGGAAVCFSVTRSCTSSTSSSMYPSLHSLLQNAISPLHPQETSFVRNHELNR